MFTRVLEFRAICALPQRMFGHLCIYGVQLSAHIFHAIQRKEMLFNYQQKVVKTIWINCLIFAIKTFVSFGQCDIFKLKCPSTGLLLGGFV